MRGARPGLPRGAHPGGGVVSAREETPGPSRLVMAAQRAIEAAWAAGPAQHLATQAAEALDDRRMLIDPQRAEEIRQQAHQRGYEAAIEVMRQERLPMSVGLLEAQRDLDALDRGEEEPSRVRDERDALRQVLALVLLHDAAGEAIDCDRLRQALEEFQIDLTPETDQHFAEWAQQRAVDGGEAL